MARPRLPMTASNPTLAAIFERQEEIGMSNKALSALTDIDVKRLSRLRRPDNGGKTPTLREAQRLATAVGGALRLTWPKRMHKETQL